MQVSSNLTNLREQEKHDRTSKAALGVHAKKMPELPAATPNPRFNPPADGVVVRGGVINLPAYFNNNEEGLNKQLLQSYKVTGAHRLSDAVLPEVQQAKTRAAYQVVAPARVFKGKSGSIKTSKSPSHEQRHQHIIREDGVSPARQAHQSQGRKDYDYNMYGASLNNRQVFDELNSIIKQ